MTFTDSIYYLLRNQLQQITSQVLKGEIKKEEATGRSIALFGRIEEAEREMGVVANEEERERLANLRRLHARLEEAI